MLAVELQPKIMRFIASNPIKLLYCDAQASIVTCVKALGIKIASFETSAPGVPASNPIIERQVGIVCDGARAMLESAGLPLCFWPYVVQAFCFHQTIDRRGGILNDEQTPYFLRHKENCS